MDPMQSVLLPDEVHPQKYRLTLTPDFEKFLFSGEVEIELDVQRSTSRIVLHSAELHIRTVECTQGEAARRPERILIDERRETATFEFAEDFEKGPEARLPGPLSSHRSRGEGPGRDQRDLRRDQLQQGSRCHPDARSPAGRRGASQRAPSLPHKAFLW